MENFIVSARKYRPTLFDSVVGQSHITTTLKNAIKSNHLAQAFLFCGPRGVGKTTCARILAKTINCQDLGTDGEACGKCTSCHSFQENTSLTIHELDAASNNSVEDIRNLIDQVRYPPQNGKYKIYIIDEVHMLSAAAFNAFLKTLEEPPSYAIFILATTEKHKILPTILSRCQIFDFNRIQWKDMASHLSFIAEKEGITAEPAALELISIKADGGLRDALSMFDLNVTFSTDNALRHADVLENLHILDSDYYFQLTDFFVNQNHTDALVLLDEIMRKGFDGQQFIAGLSEHFRNLLFAKDPKTLALMELSEENRAKFQAQSAKTSASFLLSAMNLCSQCEIHYKAAKNARLHVELTLLKINYLPSVYQPTASQPAVEGGAGKKSESKPIAPAAVSAPIGNTPPAPIANTPPAPIANTPSVAAAPEAAPVAVMVTQEAPAETPRPTSHGLRSAKKVVSNSQAEHAAEVIAQGKVQNEPFTFEELHFVWTQIALGFKQGNFINKYVMMNREISLVDSIIHIKVEGEVQMQQFNDSLKLELLGTLREKLKNDTIDISLDLIAGDVSDKKMIYTQSDKYDFLSQKHPILVEMKQRMGLDHEF
ncbi:DNA polymerase III subunit gamma/tau [Aquirufa antheringensis]|uniref:DNA polymerase III subunit gamma/tau n=1 Tax=Aquirufa antheringensis TaxID=2516559 RepID=A0A4Q9B8Z1_9BACT|nr:DNA polymerase III subunit gamma/tau [Aquirufa antheringensis]MCZ2485563.1 DNA polymerase III subunit gamma/tau [Aquirufa antheringensis]MCZ2486732.1 DNA polymerase III subunit gamma/tau [Aquirufa antheringensis]MCZ2488487.1 DNA polymerase III subunit gamma/tau [Aquirufa antheringensis]TBH71959.1 DNA polymerase III subunit gamma/tau [Aquirufa antheringensis]